jgi:hypothetical protein
MSDPVKVAGICMSGLGAICFAALGQMELCYSFAGVFGAILGFPIIGQGIQKLVK